jgi:DNA-binding transcriptional LysR family regulator
VELRQLRYFVAVAEELHFGRAADRLHMSQSPLSRAIRELERELGVVLFVRTTRRVELTSAGLVLLERSRRALAEIDGAVAGARRAAEPDGTIGIAHGPFGRSVVLQIVEEMERRSRWRLRLDEEVTQDALRRVAGHELTAAVVLATPAAARRHGVRVDTLRDEPLFAALPESHEYASAESIPVGVFAAERVLLPREPAGQVFNDWLRSVVRAAGFELGRTLLTLSAPWDRRMLPVASGEAVSVFVRDWVEESTAGIVSVPFDPPLRVSMDLVSCWPPTEAAESLLEVALRVRNAEGWLTDRPARTERPND